MLRGLVAGCWTLALAFVCLGEPVVEDASGVKF